MKKHVFFLTLLFLVGFYCQAQITSSPTLPIASNQVVITFDATQGNGGLAGFTGDVYAHTGVKVEGNSEWQYVVGSWGNNTTQPKLTRISANEYSLTISPSIREFYNVPADKKIVQMCFVFRAASGTPQSEDLFLNVVEEGLTVQISSPTLESPFYTYESTLNINVSANNATNISLLVNDAEVASTTNAELTHSYTIQEYGLQWVKVVATDGERQVADSTYFFVRGAVPLAELPSNVVPGVNRTGANEVTLVLNDPSAKKEFVFLVGDFNNWMLDENYLMNRTTDGTNYWLTLTNLDKNEYLYQYWIDGEIKIADPYTSLVIDPWNDKYITNEVFPNLKPYPSGKTDGLVSLFEVNPIPYEWEVANFTNPEKEKLNIYELHVRDFTTSGTINAVVEKLDYLQQLGVNAIELMPFNEFEGNDSWGYNPSFYFATDKAYGTPNNYKKFIDECHKRGIAVIMDIVLNHSFSQSPLLQMYFDGTKPTIDNPWYSREYNIKNPGLQWGYKFNHESVHTQALVDSLLSYWMSEYKIDGFRFDFTKGFTNKVYPVSSWASEYDASRIALLKRMVDEVWKRKEDAIVIFEHLADNSEEKELADYGILLWGNMNHNSAEGIMGYHGSGKSDLSWASYQSRNWNEPNLVTYLESHDEERVTFKAISYGDSNGDYSVKELPTALQRHAAAAVVLFSMPGPKMIWQFGELGYDVSIDDGGRLGRKPVRWEYLDNPDRAKLYEVYKQMFQLRSNEEPFSTSNYNINVSSAVKIVELHHTDFDVYVVANLALTARTVNVEFSQPGWWYNHFVGDSILVADLTVPIVLEPGDYRVYSSNKMSGFVSNADTSTRVNPKLSLYPNPVADELIIETNGEATKVVVYSVEGRVCMEQNFSSKVPVRQLPSGLYILRVEFADGTIEHQRFIKKS